MPKERIVVKRPFRERVDVVAAHRPDRNDRIPAGVVWNMSLLARSLAGTTVAFLAAGAAALAQSENCTHDTLAIDGGSVAAAFCVGAPADHVTVTETFSRGGQHIVRPLDLDVVSGASVTRAVDDVPLADLGSNQQLHLTIAYRNGRASLEHALLLPGALVLK